MGRLAGEGRVSCRSEAAGLIEHFTQEWVSDGHGEAEPAPRLVGVLDVSCAWGEEGGEGDFDKAELEVIAFAHEVQDAAPLVDG